VCHTEGMQQINDDLREDSVEWDISDAEDGVLGKHLYFQKFSKIVSIGEGQFSRAGVKA
jgi:hypothetical protein